MEWLQSLFLGVVQGITEFLPVSSDGHLAVFQILFARWLGRTRTDAENLLFDVMLHVGTLSAILVYYRGVIRDGIRGFLKDDDSSPYRRDVVIRALALAFVATLPLAPYKLFKLKEKIEHTFSDPKVVGAGFLVTAAALLITARLRGGERGPRETAWWMALAVGIAQAFAPLPGVSRSGLTIAMALALGFRRIWAVGFSLLIAVPAIAGAAFFELKDIDKSLLTPDRVAQTAAATVVAGLVGYAAIAWLVRVVRAGKVWYFSVYLIALALLVFGLLATGQGSRNDARRAAALDRPPALKPDGAGGGHVPGRALDRPDPAVPRPPGPRPRPAHAGGRRPEGPRLG
ncbi:MAG TPA: undecaprenyl-diphosphate phosphatase [Isosphaeraceae bacterium]|jgi:undecaprenyl-diphosphatase|nr:undecaprenyl-diphosphate phosphatase [Isosphaeraceae bacterium]